MDLATASRFPSVAIRRLAALACVSTVVFAGGCFFPGGSMQSGGASTYESTPDSPKTVTIRNTVTREDIWTCDVPVGQQLVIWFYPNTRPDDALFPDTMDWELMPAGVRYGSLDNTVPMPGPSSRAVTLTLRKSPEAPPPAPADAGKPSGEGL